MQMKELPYEIRSKQSFQNLITHFRLTIPDEQRPFGWTIDKWVLVVLKNMLDAFEENRQYHGGTIIILKTEQSDEIRDAQHRITVLYIASIAIIRLSTSDKFKEKMLEFLCKIDDRDGINELPSDEEIAIFEQNEWKYLPKIRSSYDNDFKELGDYINSSIRPTFPCTVQKKGNTCNFIAYSQEELVAHELRHGPKKSLFVCCKGCVHACKTKKEIDDHNLSVHGECDEEDESLIKYAHQAIEKYLQETYSEEKRQKLFHYLVKHVLFDIMETTDLDFSRELSTNINNIGVKMPDHIRLRNAITRKTDRSIKQDVITFFNEINTLSSKYELMNVNRLLFIGQNIIRKEWVTCRQFTDSGTFVEMFERNPTEPPNDVFKRFKEQCTTVLRILDHISTNTYGKLLSGFGFTKGYEIRVYLLIPIGCIYGMGVLEKYYKLLIQESLKADCATPFGINPKAYCNAIHALMKRVVTGEMPEEEFHNNLKHVFKASRKLQTKEQFIEAYTTYNFNKKTNMAKKILQYIHVMTDTKESTMNIDIVDLEHIIPQSEKGQQVLESPELRYTLGNLTLFLGPNPKEATSTMKGNRSLRDAAFSVKLQEYKNSNIAMTRDIRKWEAEFADTQIKERTKELVDTLYKLV